MVACPRRDRAGGGPEAAARPGHRHRLSGAHQQGPTRRPGSSALGSLAHRGSACCAEELATIGRRAGGRRPALPGFTRYRWDRHRGDSVPIKGAWPDRAGTSGHRASHGAGDSGRASTTESSRSGCPSEMSRVAGGARDRGPRSPARPGGRRAGGCSRTTPHRRARPAHSLGRFTAVHRCQPGAGQTRYSRSRRPRSAVPIGPPLPAAHAGDGPCPVRRRRQRESHRLASCPSGGPSGGADQAAVSAVARPPVARAWRRFCCSGMATPGGGSGREPRFPVHERPARVALVLHPPGAVAGCVQAARGSADGAQSASSQARARAFSSAGRGSTFPA